MDLLSAIDAYNKATSQQKIEVMPRRGGSEVMLPRVGRWFAAASTEAANAALLCEEARLAIAAGLSEEARGAIAAELALLEAGLRELLGELEGPTTP